MTPDTFEVGNRYENMKGTYEVLAIEGNVMRIQWEDGEEITTSVFMQRRILKRLNQEQEKREMMASKQQKMAKPRPSKKKAAEPGSQSGKKESVPDTTGIKKRYLKTKRVCKVTFVVPGTVAGEAKSVCIVGDFNDWNNTATPMKQRKSKDFAVTLELEPEREYQFRYLIDGSKWENDRNADRHVASPFGDSQNSVVSV
jgi:hypothetical protein